MWVSISHATQKLCKYTRNTGVVYESELCIRDYKISSAHTLDVPFSGPKIRDAILGAPLMRIVMFLGVSSQIRLWKLAHRYICT